MTLPLTAYPFLDMVCTVSFEKSPFYHFCENTPSLSSFPPGEGKESLSTLMGED
jgi:hypothetical protein